jgi:hypothetical protein
MIQCGLDPHTIQIKDVTVVEGGDQVKIKVKDHTDLARVHVFAQHYIPTNT